MHRILSILLIALSFGCVSKIQADSFPQPVKAKIVAEDASVQPGQPFWVAVTLDIDEGWHAYWKNPGMNGFPPSIEWTLPEGYSAEEPSWPLPERLEQHEGVSYGYHDRLTLLTEITPSAAAAESEVELRADVNWLVCSDSACLPGGETLSLTLPMKNSPPEKNQSALSLFKTARAKSPTKRESLAVKSDGEALHLDLSHRGHITHAYFYPEEAGVIDDSSYVSVTPKSGRYFVTLQAEDQDLAMLTGVLVLHDGDTVIDAVHVDHPVQKVSDDIAMADIPLINSMSEPHAFQGGLLGAIALAFLGGMILNLMPCVLPVISLKIFSFVKMAGEDRWKIATHGLMFTLGVLVSFWALAGVLIALRAYGEVVGWGFQLQDPLFVALLAALIYIFGLSLFGMFEVGTMFSAWAGQKQSDASKSAGGGTAAFFSGVLATAVATPCTGPFLGPAVGFALTLSAPYALMIFTSLALGMAFPYLIISAFPPLIKFLPKPGNWMVVFKEVLGFFMVATALWLVTIFAYQTSVEALSGLMGGLFILTFACWIWGKWATPLVKRPIRLGATVFTVLIGLYGFYFIIQAPSLSPPQTELVAMAEGGVSGDHIHKWTPFSPNRLKELQEEEKPVFIDFTAKWCLICQANHLVLETDSVSQKMADLGVVKMLADWTKNDPAITKALSEYGRSGVPLYLLYHPNGEVEVLPQTLTPDIVLGYLEHIKS